MFQSINPTLSRWIQPDRDKIYIIPTKVGAFFVFITLVMLLVGSGYANNLVNMLAFFMFSLVFVAMVLTQAQLKGVSLEALEIAPAFSGDQSEIRATIRNANPLERYGIEVDQSGPRYLKPSQVNRIEWTLPAGSRGRHRLNRLEVHSVFPLGLFHAWKVLPTEIEYWVYPKLEGQLPLPNEASDGAGESQGSLSVLPGDDFKGHRKFIPGDSPRQIDWKAHARGRPMLLKEINEGEPPDELFDWKILSDFGLNDEAKLSQFAVWIQEAASRGIGFTLRMPHVDTLSGRGPEHATRCLERLALFPGVNS